MYGLLQKDAEAVKGRKRGSAGKARDRLATAHANGKIERVFGTCGGFEPEKRQCSRRMLDQNCPAMMGLYLDQLIDRVIGVRSRARICFFATIL